MANLNGCSIRFYTTSDNKDDDTRIIASIIDSNGDVSAELDGCFGEFNDQTDTDSFDFAISKNSEKSTIANGTLAIEIKPNGNDTWRFRFCVTLFFDDGSIRSGRAGKLELNQDSRTRNFNLNSLLVSNDGCPDSLSSDSFPYKEGKWTTVQSFAGVQSTQVFSLSSYPRVEFEWRTQIWGFFTTESGNSNTDGVATAQVTVTPGYASLQVKPNDDCDISLQIIQPSTPY